MEKNIAIIGAGPVGSYAAYLLSKKGFPVSLFDKKKSSQIGSPVQCTGLLTPEIKRFLPLSKKFLVNTFSHIQVVCSSNQHQLSLNKTEYLVDRKKFDQFILKSALKQGVVFHPCHKLIEIKKNMEGKHNLIFQHKNKLKIFSPDLIIGADGPQSLICCYLNPNKKKTFYYGLQAVVKGNFNSHTYQTFFGRKICPGFFAWLVPESKTKARIGLAASQNPNCYFNNFLKILDINPKQIIEKQAGLIPSFDPKLKTKSKNIFLLGDAASHVKATTLGGIIPGFKAAVNLTNCLTNKKLSFKNHQNLKLHLFLRKVLNKFSDKDYNKLIYLLSQPKIKKILETYSRESPKELIKKIILNEPRLLFFVKYSFY